MDENKIESIKEPMSLSEIYNMSTKNKFYEEEEKSDRIVGFGK